MLYFRSGLNKTSIVGIGAVRALLCLAAIAFITAGAPAFAESLSITAIPPDPQRLPPTVGDGIDLLRGATAGRCIDFTPPVAVPADAGSIESWTVRDAQSRSDLQKILGISGSASLNYGFYSFSAAASYFSNSRISEFTRSIVITSNVPRGIRRIDVRTVRLNELGRRSLSAGSFVNVCGSHLVVGALNGARLRIIWSLESRTETAETIVQAFLSAAARSSSANLQTTARSLTGRSDIDLRVFFESPGYRGQIPDYRESPDKLIEFSLSFATMAHQTNDYDLYYLPYVQIVPGLVSDAQIAGVLGVLDAMDRLAVLYEDSQRLTANMEFVNSHPEQFPPRSSFSQNNFEEVSRFRSAIGERAEQCRRLIRPVQCSADGLRLPNISIPIRVSRILIDVQTESFQTVGLVETADPITLFISGAFTRNRFDPSYPFILAEEASEYRVVDARGAIIDHGFFGGRPGVPISRQGLVQVRVQDNPGGYADNEHSSADTLKVRAWLQRQ